MTTTISKKENKTISKKENKTTASPSLREIRLSKGLSATEVAYHTGVSQGSIYNWENATHPPQIPLRGFIGYANALGISIEELADAIDSTFESESKAN